MLLLLANNQSSHLCCVLALHLATILCGCLQELRDEVFMKVERLFLCGLRSNNPEQRARFLQLYQKTIAINLYDRMDWVVTRQEWSNLANQFWLKQVGGWVGHICLHCAIVHGMVERYDHFATANAFLQVLESCSRARGTPRMVVGWRICIRQLFRLVAFANSCHG
jgi:hypothetical protein